MGTRREHATTLSDEVCEALGRAIVSGARPAGQVLRIEDLQHEFGYSRTVIRDALSTLASLRLINARRRVGVTVEPPSTWNVFAPDVVRWRLTSDGVADQIRSLTDLRSAVEPVAAHLAAQRAPREVAERLVQLSHQMRRHAESADLDAFLESDLEFHSLILESCGNEMFRALDEPIAHALRARHIENLMPDRPRDVPVLLHMLVAAAIESGDAATAESAMRKIVAEVQAIVAPDAGAIE